MNSNTGPDTKVTIKDGKVDIELVYSDSQHSPGYQSYLNTLERKKRKGREKSCCLDIAGNWEEKESKLIDPFGYKLNDRKSCDWENGQNYN